MISINEITFDDFSKICRCCLSNKGKMDAFEAHIENFSLANIIYNCTNELINKTDGLPREICSSCAQHLVNIHMFIETFRKVQNNIRFIHEVLKNENENNKVNSGQLTKVEIDETNLNSSDNVEETQDRISEHMNDDSLDFTEEKLFEVDDKCIKDEQGFHNLDLTEFSSDYRISDEDTSKDKSVKIEIDPQLRSGLVVFPSTAEIAKSLSAHNHMAHKITDMIPKQNENYQGIRQIISQHNLENNSKEPNMQEESKVKKVPVKRAPRECPVCHQKICYSGYSKHLTTHTGEKPHQCKHCPKSFRLISSLKSHMYLHLNLKPFKCDVCNKQFRHRPTLKVHKRVHTGEKPYVCCTCSKGFPTTSGLKRHQNQRHHNLVLSNFEEKNS